MFALQSVALSHPSVGARGVRGNGGLNGELLEDEDELLADVVELGIGERGGGGWGVRRRVEGSDGFEEAFVPSWPGGEIQELRCCQFGCLRPDKGKFKLKHCKACSLST